MYICMRNVTSSTGRFQFSMREGIEREEIRPAVVLAQPGALGDDVADGAGALLVPADALQPAPHGPAAVAVHDDRDVPGEPLARRGRPVT